MLNVFRPTNLHTLKVLLLDDKNELLGLPGTHRLVADVSTSPDEWGSHLLHLVTDKVPLLLRLQGHQRHAALPEQVVL